MRLGERSLGSSGARRMDPGDETVGMEPGNEVGQWRLGIRYYLVHVSKKNGSKNKLC